MSQDITIKITLAEEGLNEKTRDLKMLPPEEVKKLPAGLRRALSEHCNFQDGGDLHWYFVRNKAHNYFFQESVDFYVKGHFNLGTPEVSNSSGTSTLYNVDKHKQDITLTASEITHGAFIEVVDHFCSCVGYDIKDFQDHLCKTICTQFPVYEVEIEYLLKKLYATAERYPTKVNRDLFKFLGERMILFRNALAKNETVLSLLRQKTDAKDLLLSIVSSFDKASIQSLVAKCKEIDQLSEVTGLLQSFSNKHNPGAAPAQAAQAAQLARPAQIPQSNQAAQPAQAAQPVQSARPTQTPQLNQAAQPAQLARPSQPTGQFQPADTPQHAQPTQTRHSNEFFGQPQSSGSGLPGNQVQTGQQVPRSPRTQPIQNKVPALNKLVQFEDNAARNATYGTPAQDTAHGSTTKKSKRPHDSGATARDHVFDHALNDPSSDYEADTLTTNRHKRVRNSDVSKSVTGMSGYGTDSFTPNRRKSARRSNINNYFSNDHLGDFLFDYENDNSDERVGELTQRSIPNANNYGLEYPLNDRLRENTTNSNIFTQAREHAPNLLPEANRVGQVSDTDGKIIFTEDMYKPDKYIKPTKEGEYWFVSQEKWDNSSRGSQWLYHRAFLICETTAGKVAEQPCTECHRRGIECRVFADPKKGASCAYCIIHRSTGCSHNAD
ncbi:hypothetical protein E2P81_ATG10589 [Venturia nashicola]|nr:hypothetical protein E2P81_ATG10589 [Venturia nashicola]